MSTGYTAYIKDRDVSFNQFVWIIARAFGSFIELRDDSLDKSIPRDLLEGTRPAEDWHAKGAAEAEDRLAELRRMSASAAEKAAQVAYKKLSQAWEKTTRDHERDEQRYCTMLEKVRAWQPPTPEHVRMKTFMIEQIEDSIRVDCGSTDSWKPIEHSGAEWLAREIADAECDLAYHCEKQAENDAQHRERRAWVKALLDSVPYEPPPRRG